MDANWGELFDFFADRNREPDNYAGSGLIPERFQYEDTTPFAREHANKSGIYDSEFIREVTRAALNQGVTPIRALGTYMKESNFGKFGPRNGENVWLNPGQSSRANAANVNERMNMQGWTEGPKMPGYFPALRKELIFDTMRQMREADTKYGKDTDRSIRQYNYNAPSDVVKTKEFALDLMRNEIIKKILQEETEMAPYRWEYPD